MHMFYAQTTYCLLQKAVYIYSRLKVMTLEESFQPLESGGVNDFDMW